ncbi:MAG: SLC13 family permease [Burkholderiales bacterium]|nr:SLC13 family permease [Burkholderiales bacterium]MDP2399099.1 SLC13 family permease [Burkholderiales bacterium]
MTSSKSASLLALVIVAVAAAIFFAPPPAGVSVNVMHTGGLLVLVMGFWATGILPEALTALMFFALAVLLEVAKPEVIFSGFASGTLWLVLGGLVIAEAVRMTGLGERIARAALGTRIWTYPQLVTAAVLVAVVLAFLMPATVGRILLLVPILAAVAERHGLAPGTPGHSGVLFATIIASFQCGTAILPANAPNLVLAGAAETLYGVQLIYAEYLWAQFPVMGIIKGALIVVLVCWMFPAQTCAAGVAAELRPMSGNEKRLAVIVLVALALWASDFLHGIRPGWIALAAAVVAMLPRIGAVPASIFQERVKFGTFFYIGGILGFGAVMLDTGLSKAIGDALLQVVRLERDADAANFIMLSVLSTLASMLVTNPAQPALLSPLAGTFAEAAGWPLQAALMTMAVGFSTLLFPYQAPPVVVGMQMAGLRLRDALRLTLPLALISIFALIPLHYLWWRVIGYFGN